MFRRARGSAPPYDGRLSRFLHTMCRITDPARSRGFYEALGFTFAREMDIVRGGEREATNYFFSLGDDESILELTFNHDGRTYDLGSGYGHIALAVDDLDETLARLLGPAEPEVGCETCFDELDRYVELELAGLDAEASIPGLRAHLAGCPACSEEHESLRALVADVVQ